VAATTKIYALSLTMRNSSGKLVPGGDTASCVFAGVAEKQADNSAGVDDAVKCVVHKRGEWYFDKSGTPGVGDVVYLVDDHTVALASVTTNDIPCGKVTDADSGGVWVRITGYAI
jgi:hypothetical protein